jgi:hypothetical protein
MAEPFKPFKGLLGHEIEKIRSAYPMLRNIQGTTGVPWQAMAAIWRRESFSMAAPKTPGGPWQFDPIPSMGTLRGLLSRFTQLSDGEKDRLLALGVNDFYAGGILAACFLRNKTGPVISPECADEVIKDAFYGYNGRKYGSADRSPYVMNGFDKAHYPMRLRGTIPDGKGERIWVDREEKNPGAYTIYKQLKALFP